MTILEGINLFLIKNPLILRGDFWGNKINKIEEIFK